MTLDTYGLPEEQILELFQEHAQFHFRTMRAMIVASFEENVDINNWPHDVVWKMYESISYDVSDEARLIQKENNPDQIKVRSWDSGPSRDELMEELKAVNAKVEALVDYLAEYFSEKNVKKKE